MYACTYNQAPNIRVADVPSRDGFNPNVGSSKTIFCDSHDISAITGWRSRTLEVYHIITTVQYAAQHTHSNQEGDVPLGISRDNCKTRSPRLPRSWRGLESPLLSGRLLLWRTRGHSRGSWSSSCKRGWNKERIDLHCLRHREKLPTWWGCLCECNCVKKALKVGIQSSGFSF
jgi:hypothetical protein